jgi:hypothetical protein
MKDITDKLNFIEIKNFCSAKGNIENEKTSHSLGKIFAKYI